MSAGCARKALSLMGKIVTASAVYKRVESEADGKVYRTWKPNPIEPRAGWLVGWRTLQNGQLKDGYKDYGDPYEPPEPTGPYLDNVVSVPAACVVFWPTMKPVYVPWDMLVDGGEPKSPAAMCKWDEKDRQYLRDEMRDVPRDAKGRWLP